jgi:lysine 2,3-aminomutase
MESNWTQIIRDAVKDTAELSLILDHPIPQLDYPLFLPRPFLEKIKKAGPKSALWKQFIPHENEFLMNGGLFDPIADQLHSPTPMIVHRYPNKALFLPTTTCPVICRYCFRKNELANKNELFQPQFEQAFEYLQSHPEIEEIIFSGGDPFMLSTKKLANFVERLSEIKHLRYLRFHTRFPTIVPERFDSELLGWLEGIQDKFERLVIVVHTNHVSELDRPVTNTLNKIIDTGVALYSQSVLLKNVNDSVDDLVLLFKAIIRAKITPFYLHHPDNAMGAQDFCLELERGAQLYTQVKKRLPGWAVPRYVIERPEGLGKVDVLSLLKDFI